MGKESCGFRYKSDWCKYFTIWWRLCASGRVTLHRLVGEARLNENFYLCLCQQQNESCCNNVLYSENVSSSAQDLVELKSWVFCCSSKQLSLWTSAGGGSCWDWCCGKLTSNPTPIYNLQNALFSFTPQLGIKVANYNSHVVSLFCPVFFQVILFFFLSSLISLSSFFRLTQHFLITLPSSGDKSLCNTTFLSSHY